MDLLEHAVRSIEEFMGLPFPRRQVIYSFQKALGGGKNLGTHVSIGGDEQVLSRERILSVVAHEASHYYWSGPPAWMIEGAAELLASMAKNTLHGPLDNAPCALARNIAEFEDLDRAPSTSGDALYCPYSLGERLFHDLYRSMDDTTFRLAFRRLYLHTVFDVPGDHCNATLTVCQVKEAFTAYVHGETVATVVKVIDRWYHGTGPYDLSWIDDTPVNAGIAALDGRIEGAYLSLSRGGPPISVVAVGPNRSPAIYLSLDYSYRNSGGLEPLPIEIAHYFEDGFDFLRRRTELPVPADVTRRTHHILMPHEKALGRYWVQVYWGDQKIAEATFETVPASDTSSIRGMVTVPDGRPPGRIGLWVIERGEESFWVEGAPDGAFNAAVPSGSFILAVYVLVGSEWRFVGWYDGSGGITTDPSQAFEVIVDGASVDGIAIRLPTDADALLLKPGEQ